VSKFKGFQRITLQPGEKKRVEFLLTAEELGFWNREMRFAVEPGEFKVMVGSSSEDLTEATFVVAQPK
jgi:beta-glucosidase